MNMKREGALTEKLNAKREGKEPTVAVDAPGIIKSFNGLGLV